MKAIAHGLLILVLGCLVIQASVFSQEKNMSHVYIRQIMTGWEETPGQEGLLPTAVEEAKIAARHAELAISKPDDLNWIQLHTGHVMHAIDPSSVDLSGPGKGYGVLRAAQEIAQRIQRAAEAQDASDNVKLHAVHVKTSAQNVVQWSRQVLELGRRVRQAEEASTTIEPARTIKAQVQDILEGRDADQDGEITWRQGEGGLRHVAKHMGLMREGEGLE